MIQLEEPALALNDVRVGGHIHPSRSIKVRSGDSAEDIFNCIANYAETVPGGQLRSVVLNCHGTPGRLQLGQSITIRDRSHFRKLRGKVHTIWITACRFASRGSVQGGVLPTVTDGVAFCSALAADARCNVIASIHTQHIPKIGIPKGSVDNFEGMLLCFRNDGTIAWNQKNPMLSTE